MWNELEIMVTFKGHWEKWNGEAVTESELKHSMNHGCQCMSRQGLEKRVIGLPRH